ncbi:hypothetical protein C8Q76DRAFT_695180 [Earliella scabrosa]|nr:hypothetical protein C8Q76DRAFT_695180 [Earliella scabrosa]
MSSTELAVSHWREHRFRVSDLPFEAAVRSLSGVSPWVELRRASEYEWVFCMPGTNRPAIFSYAGIFAAADDYYTGNLVPNGCQAPSGMEGDRVEKYASFRCNYTYCLDTKDDSQIFILQGELDNFVAEVPGFNPTGTMRREWQSGAGFGTTSRFWMKVPMFVRNKDGERKPPAARHLHPWVVNADRKSRAYRANVARPEVYGLTNQGYPVDIRKCENTRLEKGDAVAFSFTVVYVVGGKDWYPQLLPVDLVRVQEHEPSAMSYSKNDFMENMEVMVRPGRLDIPLLDGPPNGKHAAGEVRAANGHEERQNDIQMGTGEAQIGSQQTAEATAKLTSDNEGLTSKSEVQSNKVGVAIEQVRQEDAVGDDAVLVDARSIDEVDEETVLVESVGAVAKASSSNGTGDEAMETGVEGVKASYRPRRGRANGRAAA